MRPLLEHLKDASRLVSAFCRSMGSKNLWGVVFPHAQGHTTIHSHHTKTKRPHSKRSPSPLFQPSTSTALAALAAAVALAAVEGEGEGCTVRMAGSAHGLAPRPPHAHIPQNATKIAPRLHGTHQQQPSPPPSHAIIAVESMPHSSEGMAETPTEEGAELFLNPSIQNQCKPKTAGAYHR